MCKETSPFVPNSESGSKDKVSVKFRAWFNGYIQLVYGFRDGFVLLLYFNIFLASYALEFYIKVSYGSLQ